MNNTFDFKRFGQVLAKDWKGYFRNFGISLIVWCCLPVLFWIAGLVLETDIFEGTRLTLIALFVFTVLLFAPSKVYGKANLSREGVGFAMLPATSTEKFFSMLIYCSIVTPLIVGLGSWAVDSLLTTLPFGRFVGYVTLPKNFLVQILITIACYILMVSSIFLFGNVLFKKRKVGKTLAWAMLITFVLVLVLQLFNFWVFFAHWVSKAVVQDMLVWYMDAFVLVIAIFFFALTYRKIKNQKY